MSKGPKKRKKRPLLKAAPPEHYEPWIRKVAADIQAAEDERFLEAAEKLIEEMTCDDMHTDY